MSQVTLNQKSKIEVKVLKPPNKEDILKNIMLMICQMASLFNLFPFGVLFFGTVCSIETYYLSIVAVSVGGLIAGAPIVKYLIAMTIVWIYRGFFSRKKENQILSAAVFSGAILIGGVYKILFSSDVVYDILLLLGEIVITFIGYFVFANLDELIEQNKKNEYISQENAVSLVIVLAVLLWGLGKLTLPFSLNLKAIIGIYLILATTMYTQIPVAVTFSLVCGFVIADDFSNSLAVSGIYGISAVFSGLLKYFGNIGASIGFLSGVTFSVLCIGNTNIMSLIEVFISTFIFGILPMKYHQRTGIFMANAFKTTTFRREFRIKEYITEELNCFSNTFMEFARQFKNTFQRTLDNSISCHRVFDETAERICSECIRSSECWQKNFNDTYKYMFSIFEITEQTGHCDIHNAPIVFTQKCIQPELYLSEFNHVYELHKQESLRRGIRTGERRLVSNQYKEISKIISELSEEIEGNFYFDEQKEKEINLECANRGLYLRDINVVKNSEGYYEMFFAPGVDADSEKVVKIASEVLGTKMKRVFCKNKSIIKLSTDNIYEVDVSVSQKKKDDEVVCGDTVVHFETEKNKYYSIICDGMGSGTDASKESKMTAELLGGFLKAGFSKHTALSLINSTLALKMDREGFSTIDLCEIDLRSGEVEFIKIGGAESYLKTGEKLETITQKGLPAGILEEVPCEKIKRTLKENDMIVMVSDGVSEAGYGMMRGEWVKRIMKLEGLSSEEMSSSIVNSARKKIYPRTPDDMSAVVIKIKKIIEKENDLEEAI